jgi:hypothetical protein
MLDAGMVERVFLARLALPPPSGVTLFVYLLQCYRRAATLARRLPTKAWTAKDLCSVHNVPL